jgi:signal transduction histidine kinase/ActR/RegA family two-component response regulator
MDGTSLFGLTVIIEDDPGHAVLIKRGVSRSVREVVVSNSLSEGLVAVKANRPELIITDLNLPDTSGVGHVAKLLEAAPGVPVLVLTSSTSIQDAVRAMHLGASDYIIKSFDQNFQEMMVLTLERLKASQDLKAQKLKLEREMSALRVAIENGQDGMAVLNHEGDIQYFNTGLKRFIDLCQGSAGNILNIFGQKVKGRPKLQEALRDHLAGLAEGAAWSAEVSFADEEDTAFDLSLSVLERSQASSGTLVLWVRDITERKRRERFQKEILSTTTHDLRGPLGSISLCGEMLLDLLKTPDKAQELSKRVLSSARGALNLIDEFLQARRLQEGTFVLQPTKSNVCSLAEAVISEQRVVADARGISLSLKTSELNEGMVDGLAFQRALQNLVSNALKYTNKGGAVTVAVNVSNGVTAVSVSDTGSGMEPAEVQRLFERFSRLAKHSHIQGSGLGLYLVKNIVSAHGGSVLVTSQPGKGSAFTLEFPANPPVNEKGQILCLDFA